MVTLHYKNVSDLKVDDTETLMPKNIWNHCYFLWLEVLEETATTYLSKSVLQPSNPDVGFWTMMRYVSLTSCVPFIFVQRLCYWLSLVLLTLTLCYTGVWNFEFGDKGIESFNWSWSCTNSGCPRNYSAVNRAGWNVKGTSSRSQGKYILCLPKYKLRIFPHSMSGLSHLKHDLCEYFMDSWGFHGGIILCLNKHCSGHHCQWAHQFWRWFCAFFHIHAWHTAIWSSC